MSEELKPIKLSFSLSIIREKASYDTQSLLAVKFEEQVPADIDPILYAKKRIKEEIDRQKAVVASHAVKREPPPEIDPLA